VVAEEDPPERVVAAAVLAPSRVDIVYDAQGQRIQICRGRQLHCWSSTLDCRANPSCCAAPWTPAGCFVRTRTKVNTFVDIRYPLWQPARAGSHL